MNLAKSISSCMSAVATSTLIGASLLLGACAGPSNNSTSENNLAVDSAASGILGGTVVGADSSVSKVVVAMVGFTKDGKQSLCTASLISDKVAITAAHCLENLREAILVFSPDISTADRNHVRAVTKAVAHPDYKKTLQRFQTMSMFETPDDIKDQSDLGVLRFEGGLPEGYYPVAMLKDETVLKTGTEAVLTGYGMTNGVTGEIGSNLQFVRIPIFNPNFSATEVAFDQRTGKGACHGDSGGPAYVTVMGKLYLFGLTSRADTADCTGYSRYTKVTSYQRWISVMKTVLN